MRSCSVEGCDKKVKANGLCSMHYTRLRRHGSLEPPIPKSKALLQKGLGYCPKCDLNKNILEFSLDKYTFTGYAIYCKKCNNKNGKTRYLEDPLKHKNYTLKKEYGISLDEYNLLLEKQNHVCVICGNKNTKDGKEIHLAVDHCHKTSKIRGLLCSRCNLAMGKFEDNIELLQKTINYLKESNV